MKNNNNTEREWRPCPFFEKTHDVSNDGLVRRLPFTIERESCEHAKPRSGHQAGGTWSYKGGVIAAQINQHGYEVINFQMKGKIKTVSVHRLVAIAFKVDGYEKWIKNPEKYSVDHFPDRTKTNNSKENLRFATQSQQKHNSGIQRDNQTGFRGVCKQKRSDKYVYRYQIQHNKVTYANSDCGVKFYETMEEAARARDLRVIELENEGIMPLNDAQLNFPELRQRIDPSTIKKQPYNIGTPVGGVKANSKLLVKNQKLHNRRARLRFKKERQAMKNEN